MSNLTAAQAARVNALLDTQRRIDGRVTTWRTLIETGYFTTRRVENDTYYLCTDEGANSGYKVPKMVSDWAGALPTLTIKTDSGNRITSKDWN